MASFKMESRAGKTKEEISQTLCKVACSNFQYILDMTPNCWIVISSTWREHFELPVLKDILANHGIDATRVIGITPSILHYHVYGNPGQVRGEEIQAWMDANPEYTKFVIIDDNPIGHGFEQKHKEKPCIISTSWMHGLLIDEAIDAIKILGGHAHGHKLVW